MLRLFATQSIDLARLSRVLEQSGLQFTAFCTWPSFVEDLTNAEAGVIVVRWLDVDLPTTELRAVVREQPWFPFVLVTEKDADNLRLLGRTGAPEVLFLGKEETRLSTLLQRVRLDGFFARLGKEVQDDPTLPHGLRAALLLALEQEPATSVTSLGEPACPARSVRSLARQLSRSEDYLARLAKQRRVDLHAFVSWCVVLRALQLHCGARERWETVAWRLGYASVSGLSEHFKHTLGRRPSEIHCADTEVWFAEFERRFFACPPAAGAGEGVPG